MPVLTRHRTILSHARFIGAVFSLAVGAALCCAGPLYAENLDLTGLSIEELMPIKITSLLSLAVIVGDRLTGGL